VTESWKIILPCTRAEAEALDIDTTSLALLQPPPVLMTHELEDFNDLAWELHAYFEGRPDTTMIAGIMALVPSAAHIAPKLERLPDEDWITTSQQGLSPVSAGRFYVHTQANKGRVPPGVKTFLIEASLAFGTGGHETTSGCLTMLDRLKRNGLRFEHIADIGTGTGLLAFAAQHLWPRAYVTASDIDPVSIDVTRDNAVANQVPMGQNLGRVAVCVASGTDHEMIQRRAPYDLVIANILAGPLIELAPSLCAILKEGGTLILAGLLNTQIKSVASAYRAQNMRVSAQSMIGDWPCLRLVKRRTFGWRRPVRAARKTSQPAGDFGTW
jgi:ribosomal protein L11 methyltransferase